MTRCIRSGIVRTRKTHQCRVCAGSLRKGMTWPRFTGADDEWIFTMYFHHICSQYANKFMTEQTDWEFNPGDISYAEVMEALTS